MLDIGAYVGLMLGHAVCCKSTLPRNTLHYLADRGADTLDPRQCCDVLLWMAGLRHLQSGPKISLVATEHMCVTGLQQPCQASRDHVYPYTIARRRCSYSWVQMLSSAVQRQNGLKVTVWSEGQCELT